MLFSFAYYENRMEMQCSKDMLKMSKVKCEVIRRTSHDARDGRYHVGFILKYSIWRGLRVIGDMEWASLRAHLFPHMKRINFNV